MKDDQFKRHLEIVFAFSYANQKWFVSSFTIL